MEIVSTMGVGSLEREINLEAVVAEIRNHVGDQVEADFQSNGMATIRFESGSPAYSLYRTGTFQIRGAKTARRLEVAADRFEAVIEEIGVEDVEFSFRQVTSVFMHDLGEEVNLEALALTLGLERTEYEPEQFPGLIYRPPGFDVTLLVFASGKVIIGGAIESSTAEAAIQHLEAERSAVRSGRAK